MQKSYTRGKLLINLSVGIDLSNAFWHSLHLYFNLLFLRPISLDTDFVVFLSLYTMQSIFEISDKLSTRPDNETGINLELPINFSLCVIVLPSSHFF